MNLYNAFSEESAKWKRAYLLLRWPRSLSPSSQTRGHNETFWLTLHTKTTNKEEPLVPQHKSHYLGLKELKKSVLPEAETVTFVPWPQ